MRSWTSKLTTRGWPRLLTPQLGEPLGASGMGPTFVPVNDSTANADERPEAEAEQGQNRGAAHAFHSRSDRENRRSVAETHATEAGRAGRVQIAVAVGAGRNSRCNSPATAGISVSTSAASEYHASTRQAKNSSGLSAAYGSMAVSTPASTARPMRVVGLLERAYPLRARQCRRQRRHAVTAAAQHVELVRAPTWTEHSSDVLRITAGLDDGHGKQVQANALARAVWVFLAHFPSSSW